VNLDVAVISRQAETPSPATPADLGEVIQTLTDAFAVDPHFDWFLRTGPKRDAARLGMFRYLIGGDAIKHGRIDRPAGGGAAAVWMPFDWVIRPDPPGADLQAAPVMLAATGLRRITRLLAIRADMDKHHPTDRPHAYLWFLGVAPALQGHGLGSRLLAAANARLDAEGLPAYLETGTTRNVALYRRHGYEVISEHKARKDAPNMWSMWREPGSTISI
jgi:ribosomal protein S18 acetylase RimI-like enzyme